MTPQTSFARAIWADIRHNPPLAVAAAALIFWAYLTMSLVFSHYAEAPWVGYVVGIAYEAAMVGLAWGARLRHEIKGVSHIAWTVATFVAAIISAGFAAFYGYSIHHEGYGGAATRAVPPLAAAAVVHFLLLGSNGLRAAIAAVADRAREIQLVSAMLDAAKAVKFATSDDERRDRMAELNRAQSAVRGSGAADVVKLTETWCDRDAAIDTALRLVADRSASWLDTETEPRLLLPASVHDRITADGAGQGETVTSSGTVTKPLVSAAATPSHQTVTLRICAAPGCHNSLDGFRSNRKTCSDACRSALRRARPVN